MNTLQAEMVRLALAARKNAYAPYSKFQVGACILTTAGKLFNGCNVENASYGLTVCAEASAISMMVAQGEYEISEVVVAGPANVLCTPCGSCRQRLWEFSKSTVPIHICQNDQILKTIPLGELFTHPFDSQTLEHTL